MKPHGVILATLEPELLKTLKGSSKIKLFVWKREPFITFWPPEHENIYICVFEPGPGRVNLGSTGTESALPCWALVLFLCIRVLLWFALVLFLFIRVLLCFALVLFLFICGLLCFAFLLPLTSLCVALRHVALFSCSACVAMSVLCLLCLLASLA